MRAARIDSNEITISNGQRFLGMVVPRQGEFDARDATGTLLGKFPSVKAARTAILTAERERAAG